MGIKVKLSQLFSRPTAPANANENTSIVIEGTGDVVETDGGTANTGYSGPPPKRGQSITVRGTGKATSTGGGSANSGISYT